MLISQKYRFLNFILSFKISIFYSPNNVNIYVLILRVIIGLNRVKNFHKN